MVKKNAGLSIFYGIIRLWWLTSGDDERPNKRKLFCFTLFILANKPKTVASQIFSILNTTTYKDN